MAGHGTQPLRFAGPHLQVPHAPLD
ncbi:hypothetical protein J4Q44_G00047920 [Coregonus suidteri]|uniref:Uncharacterized protein n=1 Tax=Coregonus suidteri TaxID=861788 RepID=A0AAN8MJV9_9TELE